MSEWKPIDQMPAEGTFLVYIPHENSRYQYQVAIVHENVTIIGNRFSWDFPDPIAFKEIEEYNESKILSSR